MALLLGRELCRMGKLARIACIREPIDYTEYLNGNSAPVDLISDGPTGYYWTSLASYARRLKAYFQRTKPDIIVVFGPQPLIPSRLAWKGPLVVAAQNSCDIHWTGWRPGHVLLRRLEHWAMSSPRITTIACSPDAASAYAREFPSSQANMHIVMNAADVDTFIYDRAQSFADTPRILCVGTPYYQKNFHMAVRALARLRLAGVPAVLEILGDGPDTHDLKRLAASLNVQMYVTFVGSSSNVASYMRSADVLWMTSRWEGFGVVLAEAMASGLPIVATAVDGIKSVVAHGKSGTLVRSDDDANLAAATAALLRDPTRAFAMAQHAQAVAVERYAPPRMAIEYLSGLTSAYERWHQCGQ